MGRMRQVGALVGLLLAGAGCAGGHPSGSPDASKPTGEVRIDGVPHVRQKPGFGGEAAATMYLRKLGYEVDQDEVFDRTGVDPLEARGAGAEELARGLADIGFDVGRASMVVGDRGLDSAFEALRSDLRRGVPSIAELASTAGDDNARRFVLVVGYTEGGDRVLYHDPALEDGAYLAMPRSELLARWPAPGPDETRVVTRIRLVPGASDLRVSSPSPTPTRADYAQHLMALQPKLGIGMTVLLRPPFVIIGDAERSRVEEAAHKIVWLAAEDYERHYFHTRPPITDVWMFRSDETYRYHTRRLTGGAPATPYGFYDEETHAIYANMATGGGTLLHELVHPYVHASFPECPPWYNEGMGALFEGSQIRGGRLVGALNWRINGLKHAIKTGRLRPLADIVDDDAATFYGPDRADNYAAARYLVFYLQERGLLDAFHESLLLHHATDPSGRRTLERTLGERLGRFEPRWRNWVQELEQQPVFLTFTEPELVDAQRWRF